MRRSGRNSIRSALGPSARTLLVLFQIVWLNAFLPGHTRGQITMGASDAPCSSSTSRCCPKTGKPLPAEGQAPSDEDRGRCAVCFFAKGLSNDPAPVLSLSPLGLIDILPPSAALAAPSLDRIETYLGRAPPMI